ncbi:unnamed protein product [Closterium sp. Naga37s-1]|nr:unnamed protein product [Closterium sp. Naga37s-1]
MLTIRMLHFTLALPPALSGQEDTVLLHHALQCGTKQWGELGRSGQLKRSNKSCCNRYIFLRRKFTHSFRQHLLQKHLEAVGISQHLSFDRDYQPLLSQYFNQQQQQQQQQQQRLEGVGAGAVALGGLSFDECMMVFFAPNARCYRTAAPTNLSSLATPPAPHAHPPASHAAAFSPAAVRTTDFPSPRDAVAIASASNAAALRSPLKRPRGDCTGLGASQPLLEGHENGLLRDGLVRGGVVRGGLVCTTERRGQSVAEQFQQHGESSRMQAAENALLDALLLGGDQQQQGGTRNRVQRVLWPRVGSESALPDDVLLGCTSEGPAVMQRAALSAPTPTQPHAELPAPMHPQLAAPPGCAPCVGDFNPCCGDFISCIGDFNPCSALRDMSSCNAETLPWNSCGTQEQEPVDTYIDLLRDGNNNGNSNANDALFLSTPVAHLLLGAHALTVPFPSGPQQQALAASGAAGAALLEWNVQQGGTGEAGAQPHRQQQQQQQRAKSCLHLELEDILPLPLHQRLPQPLPQAPLPAAPSQHALPHGVIGALNMPSNPRGAHMDAPMQPRRAMQQQPVSLPAAALPIPCRRRGPT